MTVIDVLVTGAAGFIGSSLVDRLLEEGYRVTALDNFNDYYSGKMQFLRPHSDNPDFELIEGDILDGELVNRCMTNTDVVFHLAAQAGVRFSVDNPMRTHQINVNGTMNVLEAARNKGVKRVINASSSSVYGDPDALPVSEDTALNPISPYAASKLSAEAYCRLYADLFGVETISLRYFTVYGPRQRPDMAIRTFVDRVRKGLPPQIFGDGEQSRDFTYISDVVDANCLAMACPSPDGRVLNICSGHNIKINELVHLILDIMDAEDVSPEYLPEQPGDVDHTWGDNSLAKDVLGWEPSVSLKRGLTDFIEWYDEECKTDGH